MNNLKEIAAGFNLYQVEDIPEKYKGPSFDWKVENVKTKIPDFLQKMGSIESGVFFQCLTQKNGDNIDTYYVDDHFSLIKAKESEILLMVQFRDKKYHFYPYYSILAKYRGIDHYKQTAALKILKEPNYIGVFTEKKVNDWINYSNQYIQILNGLLLDVNKKNNDIENDIYLFIQSLPGCKVIKYNNKTEVKTEIFNVTFTHEKKSCYVGHQVEYIGKLQDITKIHLNN